MHQHPIDTMMKTTMEQIRGMVDVNTVIGSPVTGAKGSTIIPISKVSFGFVAGGGEYLMDEHRSRTAVASESYPFAGGTGAGVSVQPVGFLVVGEDGVKMLPAQSNSAMERIVELLPQLMEEFAHNNEKNKSKTPKTTTVDFIMPEDLNQ